MKHLTPFSPFNAAATALCVLACGTASAEPEVNLGAELGFDSNIFGLNESLGERDGRFTRMEAEFSAERDLSSGGNLGFDANATALAFASSVSDGDDGYFFLRVRGASGGEGREPGFGWALRVRRNDSTYVSRLTGIVGTDTSGTPIGDRFDNEIHDLQATWHAPGGDRGRVSLVGSLVNKNHLEDYASLGLDRLDYQEFLLTPEYLVEGDDGNFRLRLPLASRQYRDRRASDELGNPVVGTDLQYEYYGLDARYQRDLTRTSVLEVTAGYDLRDENGGVNERTRWNAGVEWTYRPVARTLLSVELERSSRVFDRLFTGDPTLNDEDPNKEGYTLGVRYVRPFPGLRAAGVSLFAEARLETFDNSDNVLFSYDRAQAFAGIRKEFE